MPAKAVSKRQARLYGAHCAGQKTALSGSMTHETACEMVRGQRVKKLPERAAKPTKR